MPIPVKLPICFYTKEHQIHLSEFTFFAHNNALTAQDLKVTTKSLNTCPKDKDFNNLSLKQPIISQEIGRFSVVKRIKEKLTQ